MTRNGIGNVEMYMKSQVGMVAGRGRQKIPHLGERVSALVFFAVDADVSQAAE